MCVGCRERVEPSSMLRLVSDAGECRPLVDLRQRFPGRGAYLHLRRQCVTEALKRKGLSRALGATFTVESAEELFEEMKDAARKRVLERLSLARRAGGVAAGIEPVRRALRLDAALFVCSSKDAAQGTRHQIEENCLRKTIPLCSYFDGSELGRAVGEDFVSAVAVTKEPFAADIMALSMSLADTSHDA